MFEVRNDDELVLQADEPLQSMYHLSPYVWQDGGKFRIAVRGVNHSDDPERKVARIFVGWSSDGIRFAMRGAPILEPGPPGTPDDAGCEDPSVVRANGKLYVYYSGWNRERHEAVLLLADGHDAEHLEKRGIALASSKEHANTKEATVVARGSQWHMLFEYSRGGVSRIGHATSPAVDGPWAVHDDPFEARRGAWDAAMLSTGPILEFGQKLVMLYNGATSDSDWKIGAVVFDAALHVVNRLQEPLICGSKPTSDARAIAFANSATFADDGTVWLYYSVADMQMRRATLRLLGRSLRD